MPILKCTSPGCGGTIDQGFCDRCGIAPPAGAAAALAVSSQLLTRARTGTAATRATTGTVTTGAMSGRTGITGSSTRRGTGTGRSSTRRHLGLGLVNVPGLPEINPETIVMTDPKVPDHKRFCSNPDCHDAAGEPTPLNRRLNGHCPNCGRFYSFIPTLKAGDVIAEQYEVKGCLAFGGLGWIYLAKDLTLNRWVVLKGLLNSADESAAAAAVAERQFLASVKHANIVGIYSFVKRGTEGFIVMEYVNGTTVKDVRKSRGPLPASEAISYIHRILGAFGYLHDRGLVFCDFKPDNFMLEGDPPDVKLIDMGGVRLIDDPAGDIYGTKGYSAPEAGEGPTVATDLFTIGRTLALLVMDFRFQSAFEFTLPPASEQPVLTQHQSLNRFLWKSTAKDPRQRFQSADEMAEQLAGVLREVVVAETGQASTKPVFSALFAGEPAGLDDKCDVDQPSLKLLPALRIDSEDPGADELLALSGVRDPVKLIPLLQAAAKRVPDSVEISLQLIRASIDREQFTDDEAAMRTVEERLPHDWRVKWYRGLLMLGQNKVGHAARAFDEVCTDIPGEPAAKLALAIAAELSGDDPAAIHLYDLVCATDPGMATAAFGLARCLRRAGRRADASEAYRRVPPASSLYVRAQTALARALAAMEPAPPAVDDLCSASAVIESLSLEGMESVRVRAEVLENALSLLVSQPLLADRSRQLFGQQFAETPIRFALEKSYRQMARLEPDRSRQIQLVDKANTIRPWTLV